MRSNGSIGCRNTKANWEKEIHGTFCLVLVLYGMFLLTVTVLNYLKKNQLLASFLDWQLSADYQSACRIGYKNYGFQ